MIPAANEAGVLGHRAAERPARDPEAARSRSQKLRDREPEKRWQAHYDLMLAQIVAYQIKSYEYRACLEEMVKNPPRAQGDAHPEPDRRVGDQPLARPQGRQGRRPRRSTPRRQRLLKEVIARHPKTPWADLAQDELEPRLRRPARRVAPQPEVRRAGEAGAEVLRRGTKVQWLLGVRGAAMILHTSGIAASARDPDYNDMAFIYCVDHSGYCLSLSWTPGDSAVEVMVFDQLNHKTREVAAELYPNKLLVSLSRLAASALDGNREYVVPFAVPYDELLELDAALAVIFSGVGRYERRF